MEVVILKQMVHTYADLEDAFVQVTNFSRGGSPQQLECLMLLEEFARIELVDRLHQLRWSGGGAIGAQVGRG